MQWRYGLSSLTYDLASFIVLNNLAKLARLPSACT
jgi:hypothetical protein